MNAVNLSLDKGGKREVVESVGEIVPYTVIAVLFADLVIEAIDC